MRHGCASRLASAPARCGFPSRVPAFVREPRGMRFARSQRCEFSLSTSLPSAQRLCAKACAARATRSRPSRSCSLALLKAIEELKPDVIVTYTESPSRDVLEHLVVMTHHTPRPVVMFANDGAKETIRQAVRERRLVPAGAQAKDRRLTKFVSRGARRG